MFVCGLSGPEAIRHHKRLLKNSDDFDQCWLADASICPTSNQVQYMYSKFAKRELGPTHGSELLDIIDNKIKHELDQLGCTVRIQRDPVVILILTPIMIRAHKHKQVQCTKMVFVDSTASVDTEGHVLTFLLAESVIGAVPLCAFITESDGEIDYSSAFELYKG